MNSSHYIGIMDSSEQVDMQRAAQPHVERPSALQHNNLQHRAVVSYVLRSSRLTPKLQKAWDEYSPQFLLDIPHQDSQLGVADDFASRKGFDTDFVGEHWGKERVDGSFIIEIGTGQGENIVAAAAANPDTNYLALEVFDQGIAHTLAKIGKLGLENLRIARVDAPELIACCDSALAAEVWTYFPDPWPKMKHHKRRIINAELAASVARVLRPGGVWRIATDIDDYALHVHEVMDDNPLFSNQGGKCVSLATEHVGKGTAGDAAAMPHAEFLESERFGGRVLTSFEKKGIEAGHTIHDFTYQKIEKAEIEK